MVGIGGDKKKGKYPIEREGIIYDNPEKFYDGFSSDNTSNEVGR